MLKGKRILGFTLVEVTVIAIVISGLVGAITPKLLLALRQSREATLRENVQLIRTAVDLFHRNTGLYPARLSDLTLYGVPPVGLDAEGRVKAVDSEKFNGPYLTTPDGGLPRNGVTGANVQGQDWIYETTGRDIGRVQASAGQASDGTNYSDW